MVGNWKASAEVSEQNMVGQMWDQHVGPHSVKVGLAEWVLWAESALQVRHPGLGFQDSACCGVLTATWLIQSTWAYLESILVSFSMPREH